MVHKKGNPLLAAILKYFLEVIKYCKKKKVYETDSNTDSEDSDEIEEISRTKFRPLLQNPNYYLVILANIAFGLRRGSYMSWLGSGWPGKSYNFKFRIT